MEAVFRYELWLALGVSLSAFHGHPVGELRRLPERLDNLVVLLNVPISIGEYQSKLAAGALIPPGSQGIHCHRCERDIAVAGLALGFANAAPKVGTLPDEDNAGVEIDVGPW